MPTTFEWNPNSPPFSFKCGGRPSSRLLPGWRREDLETDGDTSLHRYTDPETGISVSAQVRAFAGFSATEWVLEFANEGAGDTPIIEDILPLDLSWPRGTYETVLLHHANGSKCRMDDFLPRTTELRTGPGPELHPDGGRSSDGVLPFFNLQWPGGGAVIGIGWSGQWKAAFERGEDEMRVLAGMERTHLRLRPGEKIRTPRILLAEWEGDDPDTGNNLLRRLLLAKYCPRFDGELVLPPVAHMTMSTFHATGATSEAAELDALARAASLGVEAYWVDACWFGRTGKWYEEVGDWSVRTQTFPRGLRPISNAAHAAGMRFVLWVEPERVHRGTPIEREHPEFLLHSDHDPNNALFNVGMPEARAHLTELLSRIITEAGVDIYRQDFNMTPLPYWQAADSDDRVGMAEIRHVEGLYAMWDELLRRHPGLSIDNCASGGRRIDLETISRSFPLWRSDFSDAGGPSHGLGLQIGDQSQTVGLSRWAPLHSASVWTFTPYAFRSAMSTGIVPYCDIRVPDFPADEARRAISELKRLRPLFLGDFYPLVPLTLSARDWCAYQYDRPDLGEGFAVFLRRHESPFPTMDAALRGIDRSAEYEVGMSATFEEPPRERKSGAELANLAITVPDIPGSSLLQYRRVRS
jgi:alpha-galactosidase